jgi:hypothetical protein
MDNKALNELQARNSWEVMNLRPMIKHMAQRHRYVAWGQCPQCLDCFNIEFDSLSILTCQDIAAAFSNNHGARITRRRAGWMVSNGNYHLRITDARVQMSNGSDGWKILHKTCDKPLRILSLQQRATISPRMPMSDVVDDSGTDQSPRNGRHDYVGK